MFYYIKGRLCIIFFVQNGFYIVFYQCISLHTISKVCCYYKAFSFFCTESKINFMNFMNLITGVLTLEMCKILLFFKNLFIE